MMNGLDRKSPVREMRCINAACQIAQQGAEKAEGSASYTI